MTLSHTCLLSLLALPPVQHGSVFEPLVVGALSSDPWLPFLPSFTVSPFFPVAW